MAFKRPPRGYQDMDHPLPHNFNFDADFNIDNASTERMTYFPLILNDEGLVNPDTVIANPEHGSFAESNNAYCYKNSIIPRMNVTIRCGLAKAGIETDKLRIVNMFWLPVYTSFLNRLEAADSKTGTKIEAILELEHETTGKSCYPLWSGTDFVYSHNIGIHANATTALMGLTTDNGGEDIVFDRELFYDALQYFTNSKMLSKVVGKMHRVTLTRDRIYLYHSNNFTNPMVKRINEYTFCGIIIGATAAGTFEQHHRPLDVSDISHWTAQCHVRYDEWNKDFDQTAS